MRCPQLSCAVQEERCVTDRSVALGTSLESLGDLRCCLALPGSARSLDAASGQLRHKAIMDAVVAGSCRLCF